MTNSIILVDDHPLIREGIKSLLTMEKELTIVDEASSESELLSKLNKNPVDIVILDIIFNDKLDGLKILEKVLKKYPKTNVLILSMLSDPKYLRQALKLGASGYLLKADVSDLIIPALKSVIIGNIFVSPSLSQRIFEENSITSLSKREFQVFQLLSKGKTVKEIGIKLSISPSTVGTHIEKTKKKLGASSVNELIRISVLYEEIGRVV